MKWYVVKALSVGGLRNRVFSSGDVVNENNFPPGNAEKLREKGYLKLKEEDAEKPKDQDAQPEIVIVKPSIDDVTVKKMKDDLKAAEVNFPKDASKVELFELWISKIKK